MKKPNNYDNVQTETKKLPAGGYICEIISCEEKKSRAGNTMLEVHLDIAEGEYKGFITEHWTSVKLAVFPQVPRYPMMGTSYIVTEDAEGNCSRGFKAFCTALEDSGAIVWNRDELADLQGAQVGVIFRREENEYNGSAYWQTRPMAYRSVDSIRSGDFKVPEDKPLQSSGYPQFQQPSAPPAGFTSVAEDIPF